MIKAIIKIFIVFALITGIVYFMTRILNRYPEKGGSESSQLPVAEANQAPDSGNSGAASIVETIQKKIAEINNNFSARNHQSMEHNHVDGDMKKEEPVKDQSVSQAKKETAPVKYKIYGPIDEEDKNLTQKAFSKDTVPADTSYVSEEHSTEETLNNVETVVSIHNETISIINSIDE
jgi:hypothetical protein